VFILPPLGRLFRRCLFGFASLLHGHGTAKIRRYEQKVFVELRVVSNPEQGIQKFPKYSVRQPVILTGLRDLCAPNFYRYGGTLHGVAKSRSVTSVF